MIIGHFHKGSGLGDQLHRYITIRTLAEDKGFDWGMTGQFKGDSFMKIDKGSPIPTDAQFSTFREKDVRENGIDIRSYDPEINFIEDWTDIDGCFEDEKYWGRNIDKIRTWLHVEPMQIPDDMCVIGFRGGEYATDTNLFLNADYWSDAIQLMRERGITKFEIHTDDVPLANSLFPSIPAKQGIDINWRSVRYAKHLIIANSAFYIMPALLGEAEDIIAPRYWARRNLKVWARPACYYSDPRFQYI